MTEVVFQSKKMASRRNTNVIAIPAAAAGTTGMWKTFNRTNPATPRTDATQRWGQFVNLGKWAGRGGAKPGRLSGVHAPESSCPITRRRLSFD
jgi:hypothetical protein